VSDPSFEVHVDPAVHAQRPDYVALVRLASGLANGPSDHGSDAERAAAEAHLRSSGLQRATDHPHIAAWREAFSAFGAKPSRYPSPPRRSFPGPQGPAAAARQRAGRPLQLGERAPPRPA
jgi:hypothetical protein